MIVNAKSIDKVRIELLGESRAVTFEAEAILSAMRLLSLCRELDAELDGVRIPRSAAAIVNSIREVIAE